MRSQYYVTESELSKLFAQTGLPPNFQYQFTRDYAALKRDLNSNDDTIVELDSRLTAAESDINTLTISFDTLNLTVVGIQSDIESLDTSLNAHVGATSAHGASGNLVGTNNFCTLATGGVVKLAAAITDQPASTVNVTASPNAAGAAYVQADAQTWVIMLNDLKTQLNTLKTDYNSLVTKFNAVLASDRTASQRAP